MNPAFKRLSLETGEMSQPLRALDHLTENLGLIPRKDMTADNHL